MRTRLLRVIVFLAVFVGCSLLFAKLMNNEEVLDASDLEDPTLPVVSCDIDGMKVDLLYGYLEDMQPSDMRQGLIPVDASREIAISYIPYENNIRTVTYEITAPDTGEVVANAKIGNFKTDGDYMTAHFTLNGSILMNREYPIRFTLETDQGNINYYARLLQRSKNYTADYLTFVQSFYETCFNKEGASGLNTYLEATGESYGTVNFSNITLKSSLEMVTWGSLNPQILRKAVPTITEMNNTTCSIENDYLISAQNDSGETEVYRVKEYYRMRYGTDRIRLLDFNRSAEQVFIPSNTGVVDISYLSLGVTSSDDLQTASDDNGDILAFVKDNSLWSYSRSAEKLTRIFTFHNDTVSGDSRDDHDEYGIKIVRIQSGGDIDFTVYGYMNRGPHEGHQGILVCRYLAESSCVEERAFIEDDRGFEYLEKDLEKLSYITSSDCYYAYLSGSIIKVDLSGQEITTLLGDIDPDKLVVSSTGNTIAYANGMTSETNDTLTVMTLDDGSTRTIRTDRGNCLKALGFINDDLIYGEAVRDDLRKKLNGEIIFAMHRLVIEDASGEEVLTYEKDGIWVTDVSVKSGLIELSRVTRDEEGNYHAADTDNIMNNRQTSDEPFTLKNGSNNRQGKTVTMALNKSMTSLKPLVMSVPFRFLSDGNALSAPESEPSVPLYYVYGNGQLQEVTTKPYEAVIRADELKGIALDGEGQYIYERGSKADESEIANEYIPDAMKNSPTLDADKLQEAIGDEGTVLDLSGCSLDQVLYQVSQGRPVLARFSDGSISMIVGYNNYNTRLYDFATGEHIWYGINDSTAAFAAGGNIFITVVEPQATVKE